MAEDDLRADYERLGVLLAVEEDGSKAAALARERRMMREVLDADEDSEASVVDELAERRSGAKVAGSSSRRRRSG